MPSAVLVISDGGSGWDYYLEDQTWIKNSRKVAISLTLKFHGSSPTPDNYSQLLVKACCCCSVTQWVRLFATPWLQHARLLCLSLFPQVCSNSCPLSRWCHPTISSSATPFSSCTQSFPASVLPMNIQGSKYGLCIYSTFIFLSL